MKRAIFSLKWCKVERLWVLVSPGGMRVMRTPIKADADVLARGYVRGDAPSQLLIYTKAGKIGQGGRNEASYGCDSKRRKG